MDRNIFFVKWNDGKKMENYYLKYIYIGAGAAVKADWPMNLVKQILWCDVEEMRLDNCMMWPWDEKWGSNFSIWMTNHRFIKWKNYNKSLVSYILLFIYLKVNLKVFHIAHNFFFLVFFFFFLCRPWND